MSALIGSSLASFGQVAAPNSSASPVLGVLRDKTPEDAIGLQVARVVAGMLGYTYWPLAKNERILCVTTLSRFERILLKEIPNITSREKWKTSSLNLNNADELLDSCDALYYSAEFAILHGRLLFTVQRRPVMTIIENSDFCDEGSLFCINAKNSNRVTFQANLDAMSLTTLRVNPQVLRMGREAP